MTIHKIGIYQTYLPIHVLLLKGEDFGPEVQDQRTLKMFLCLLKKRADYCLQRAEKALQKPLSLMRG